MADLVFNVALHELDRFNWQTTPLDIRVLLLVTAEADEAMRDHEDIAALLAAASVEASTMTNYARLALTGEAKNVDNTNNRVEFNADDAAFGVLGNGANQTTTDVITFEEGASDALREPVSVHDAVFTSDGSAVTIQWATGPDAIWQAAG